MTEHNPAVKNLSLAGFVHSYNAKKKRGISKYKRNVCHTQTGTFDGKFQLRLIHTMS